MLIYIRVYRHYILLDIIVFYICDVQTYIPLSYHSGTNAKFRFPKVPHTQFNYIANSSNVTLLRRTINISVRVCRSTSIFEQRAIPCHGEDAHLKTHALYRSIGIYYVFDRHYIGHFILLDGV